METQGLDPQSAIKALFILLLIPSVIYALWSEHLTQAVKDSLLKNSKQDSTAEVQQARIFSRVLLFFQLALFLGSSKVRSFFPLLSQLVFLGTLSLQLILQSSIEKKLQPTANSPLFLRIVFRLIIVSSAAAGLYLSPIFIGVKLASFISEKLSLAHASEVLCVLLAGALGIFFGLFMNYVLVPIYLKWTFPVTELKEPQLQTLFLNRLIKEGCVPTRLLIISLGSLQIFPMFYSGIKYAGKLFAPTLFLSQSTIELLTPHEIEALLCVEISHIHLQHSQRKIRSMLLLTSIAMLIASVSVFLGHIWFGHSPTLLILPPVLTLSSFLYFFKYFSNQALNFQFEADCYSVEKLRIDRETLKQALLKLDQNQMMLIKSKERAFPDTLHRISRIDKRHSLT